MSLAVIIGEVHDNRFWKGAKTTRAIDKTNNFPSGAIREALRVINVPGEHHLATSHQVHGIAETFEDFGVALLCALLL